MQTRIILIDDHNIVREGLEKLLMCQEDFLVAGSFSNGDFAREFLLAAQIDIAIIDVAMPEVNGIEIARMLLQQSPALKVIMLSMYSNVEYVYSAIKAGALGYILKGEMAETLIEAIRQVQIGRRFLSEGIDVTKLEQYLSQKHAVNHPLLKLSARERAVLQYTAEGLSLRETAERLSISAKTVETYRGRVMEKLEISSIPDLVKFAIRYGVTSVD